MKTISGTRCKTGLGLVVLLLIGGLAWAQDKPLAGKPSADAHPRAAISGFPKQAEVFADRGGFCLDLGCGDGKLALEIAQKTKYTVFALAKDDADCDRVRQALDRAAIYGTRAAAMPGSLQKLPFPNGYGNFIVTGEYQESLDLKEVLRVLSPNGLAVIGGGKTDAGRLKAALQAAGIKDYKIDGNYAIFGGKMPEGVDDWTHFTPRPDNIHTSRETIVRPPFRTQWFLTSPPSRAGDAFETIAQGRVVYRNGNTLYAWDAFNGALLWQRKLKDTSVSRQALVGDTYYAIENDAIIALDAATGDLKREFRVPEAQWSVPWTYNSDVVSFEYTGNVSQSRRTVKTNGVYWVWLAVENGALYGLAQTPTQERCLFDTGDLFCSFDLQTGALRWKHQLKSPAGAWSAALSGDGLYFCTFTNKSADKDKLDKQGEGVVTALNANTGEQLWQGDRTAVVMPSAWPIPSPMAGYIDGKYYIWSCPDEKGMRGTKSFDGKTGKVVKDYAGFSVNACGYGPVLFVGDKLFNHDHSKLPGAKHTYFEYRAVDRGTGADVSVGISDLEKKDGCGAGSASQNCIYSGGQNLSVSDLLTGKTWRQQYFRTPCNTGPRPANGMLFVFGAFCHCGYPMRAPLSLAPGGLDWTPPAADKDLASRLVPGPAIKQPLLESGKDEWTHYRGNAGHTGETASSPKLPLVLGWERKLNGRLTPPSCGGGLVYVASQDGMVWGLDQTTGEVRWKFLCGAAVRVTPAFARGRLLFGSDDGWVYCLDARTGALAWRFRGAPEEYFINAAGQLNSIWPSTAGVVVDGDFAYGAAGLMSFDGAYLYALDLQTGKPAWSQRIGDPVAEEGAPQGIMAVTGDTIVVPTWIGTHNRGIQNKGGNQGYRKTDGTKLPWYPDNGKIPVAMSGAEAIADGDVFFYGGAGSRAPGGAFSLLNARTGWGCRNPDPQYAYLDAKIAPVNVAPVLGKKLIVGDGAGYDRATYCKQLSDNPAKLKDAIAWSVPLWGAAPAKSKTTGLTVAGNILLASGANEIVAFEAKADGKELCRVQLKDPIARNSLAVSGGDVFAVTDTGSVYALKGK